MYTYTYTWLLHQCTMRLSTQLELSKMFKSKCLDFGNFSSKSDNSSFDWWKTLKNWFEKYSNRQSYNSWSGLPGLPRVLGSLGSIRCWAPRFVGSRGWCTLCALNGAGLPRLLGSRGYWAPEFNRLHRIPSWLGSLRTLCYVCEQWKWEIWLFLISFFR